MEKIVIKEILGIFKNFIILVKVWKRLSFDIFQKVPIANVIFITTAILKITFNFDFLTIYESFIIMTYLETAICQKVCRFLVSFIKLVDLKKTINAAKIRNFQ